MKKNFWLAGVLTIISLLVNIQPALAHEAITVGDYEIVVGWVNEPPIVGQMNGVEIHVSDTSSGTEQHVEDVSSLTLTISYGGQEKTLTLEPTSEDSPGQFAALVVPNVPGEYTVRFGGFLADTAVDAETQIHEVQPMESFSFPSVDLSSQEANGFGTTEWLAIAGFVTGLAGLIVSFLNMRKERR